MTDRSVSRGREVYTSTGRGGLGNIRHASQSRDRAEPEPVLNRGREPAISPAFQPTYSTGRGGAGNIRSPSRDPLPAAVNDPREAEILKQRSEEEGVHSTGRGGLGNINRSRSRNPTDSTRTALSPQRHSESDISEEDDVKKQST
ncbi:hypothetical protein ONZ45_g12478 [Pleurotus djamor]|nr:hypothetical protein ONZ45_g18511 [Pleurotus djamor]KAJ8496416.1 hypothetical protein ONZ45_g12478 [Pleurotus djamor]